MDVDLRIPTDLSEKARRYTRQGELFYARLFGTNPKTTKKLQICLQMRNLLKRSLNGGNLPLGPGIIAFYASDGRAAGGFDTKTFVEHGFEDTDFFFRLKRVPGMNIARVVERDLTHIFHKPSLNKIPWAYRLSYDDRWRNLQREKCPTVIMSRTMLEAYDESNSIAYPERKFFVVPHDWTFRTRSELDVARKKKILTNVEPMSPLEAFAGHDVLQRERIKRNQESASLKYMRAQSLIQTRFRCNKNARGIIILGDSFCIRLHTHMRITRNVLG